MPSLKKRIETKKARIAIIGLGYVGIPCALSFSKAGYEIIGVDINKSVINNIKNNINPLNGKKINFKNKIQLSTSYSIIKKADIILICLPTPLTKFKTPDLSSIKRCARDLKNYLKKNILISFESTSYPGTTEEIFLPLLKSKNYKIGDNIFLSYSPEREDPGNKKFNLKNTTKVVSGFTDSCLDISSLLYSKICKNIFKASSIKTAEFAKLSENIYRSVNIGLINELKLLSDKMGLDIFDIVNAASTKPFGYQTFYPGPGLGGHCIPIDPYYLTWKAKEFDFNTRFTELSAQINDSMPNYIVDKLIYALNFQKKTLSNSKILLLGLAYKKNISDTRESPTYKILELLKKRSDNIHILDPYCNNNQIPKGNNAVLINFKKKIKYGLYDAIVIICDHDIFDYELISKESNLIIDSRGRYKTDNIKIFRA